MEGLPFFLGAFHSALRKKLIHNRFNQRDWKARWEITEPGLRRI